MPTLHRLGFFLLVTFFSGSIVIIAAKDLRKNLQPPTELETERAAKLVQALRGDELFHVEAKYHEPHPNLEPRKLGSFLRAYDLKKIKSFMMGLVGGIGDDDTSEPSESDSADHSK
jgi:hypothetical protein